MYSINQLFSIISNELEGTYNSRTPSNLYEPIAYSMSIGGKRIRPLLCLLAANLYTDTIDNALRPAIGLETFHNFTLLHDDIMDKADVRRNQATVHKKWNENTAILSGDAMMIESYNYFLNLSPELLSPIFKIFNQTALEVCEGQQYDMDFENRTAVKETDYIEMIRLKTAVLLAAALKIGAIIGGADTEDAKNIYDFGINMGLAFQLQDDYLDTFGDESTFGKRIGGDISENKKTFLLINAIKKAPSIINPIINGEMKETEKIMKVTQIYKDLKIDVLTEEKILSYYQKALDNLSSIKVKDKKKELLLSFLNNLKGRIS